ncbi:MAG: hypothetical protein Q9170_000135 [Blastenia crenularia]
MAEASVNPASNTAKPRFKRPLFTKPAWAEDNSSSSTDFFRRSNQTYVNIAAEAERKRQKRLSRKEQERARENKHQEPSWKRRRTLSESEPEIYSDHSSSDGITRSAQKDKRITPHVAKPKLEEARRSSSPKSRSSPKSLGQRYEREIASKKGKTNQKPLLSDIIDLDDDNESPKPHEDEIVEVTAVKRSEPPPDDDDFPPSDEEFAELARKARERARRKRLETEVLSPTPESSTSRAQDDQINGPKPLHKPVPPPAALDPVVSILITSRIINTDPLIVNRKVSQRLKDVRVTWCQRQGFTPETTTTVFLTWRGKRLFDVTTCKSLGIGMDSRGKILTKGPKDILGEEENQIHMEAMTEDILEEYQKMKRREAEGESYQESEPQAEEVAAAEKKEPQVRIILKAKGHTDFKLIVKATTRISRIVNAFKCDKNIDSGREVFCSFDGDRLAPESQVSETELNDMDYVDVYIK